MCYVMHSGALISFSINHLCTLWGVLMIGSQTFQLSHESDLIAICVLFFFFKKIIKCIIFKLRYSIFYRPASATRLLIPSFEFTCMCE